MDTRKKLYAAFVILLILNILVEIISWNISPIVPYDISTLEDGWSTLPIVPYDISTLEDGCSTLPIVPYDIITLEDGWSTLPIVPYDIITLEDGWSTLPIVPFDISTLEDGPVIHWIVNSDFAKNFPPSPINSSDLMEVLIEEIQFHKNFLQQFLITSMDMLTVLANWLNPYKIHMILFFVASYFFCNLLHENLSHSNLLKEMRIVQKLTLHGMWQIDESSEEMKALMFRLDKNRNFRIPAIVTSLKDIYSKLDAKSQKAITILSEINIWKETIIHSSKKLRQLNHQLLEHPDSAEIKKIKDAGYYAAGKILLTVEDLHDQIEVIKTVLDNTSRLMDVKGLPIRCTNGNSNL